MCMQRVIQALAIDIIMELASREQDRRRGSRASGALDCGVRPGLLIEACRIRK